MAIPIITYFLRPRGGTVVVIRVAGTVMWLVCGSFLVPCAAREEPVPPIDTGYGAEGGYSVAVDSLSRRARSRDKTYVYRPRDVDGPAPLVFFLHGLGTDNPAVYGHIAHHLAGRGCCVVLPQYRMFSFPGQRRTYRKLFARMVETVAELGSAVDTSRIGFVGHSFGGAAIPALALRLIVQRGWGSRAAFMFVMAPHFVFGITETELKGFPSHAKLVVQVYEEDDCNDHRMAKHLFETIGISESEKDFMVILSDSSESLGYKLVADHAVPYGPDDALGEIDGLDYYAVYRPLDALVDYTLTGAQEARRIALGDGSQEQRYMGVWRDGVAVKEAVAGDEPLILKPVSAYFFHWKHPWNPHNPERRKRKFLMRW